MAQVINGSDLMLFIGNKSIAFATSHKLTINAETVETTSKDNTGDWTSKQVKKLSWNATSDNLYSVDSFAILYNAMIQKTKLTVAFDIKVAGALPTTGWTGNDQGYYGEAIITSLEANAPDGDNATFSVNFEGVGALIEI